MRVAIADDSTLFREGLSALLVSAGVTVSATARTGTELETLIRRDQPDVAILDIRMPPTFTDEGIASALRLRQAYPQLGVLVLSTYAQADYAIRLLDGSSGGLGYLLKDRVDDLDTLLHGLDRVARGEPVVDREIVRGLLDRPRRASKLSLLTDREIDVLQHMAEGRSNLGIAAGLVLSAKTVETHVASIFIKLDLHADRPDNRRVLAVLAYLNSNPVL